jgi:DnaJ-class molecular chaperone
MTCPNCGGSGRIYYVDYSDPDNQVMKSEPCPTCGGSGKV